MHIFITGVAGFLGSNLSDFYIKKGFRVSGCDNLVGGDLSNVDKKVKFYKGNCEDLEFMTNATKDSVDVLCHAAAYAHEGLSSVSPTIICNNIFTGSISTFTAAIKNKIKRIVYCSSMARYGEIKPPFREDDEPKPIDPYGVSKLASEKVLEILSKTHNFEYNIAVPHNIIGPKQKYDDPFRNVVSIMVNLMLQNRQPVIYGDGEQTRCFSDIDDCIFCLDKLMTDININKQIVNIGPDNNFISVNQLFKKLSNKLQFNMEPVYMKDRPNEVKHAVCSSDKARKDLNYVNKISLDESLDKVINYIKFLGVKKFDYNYPLEIINDKTPKTWKNKIF